MQHKKVPTVAGNLDDAAICASTANVNNGNIESHLGSLSKSLDMHLNRYENVILLGDVNASIL